MHGNTGYRQNQDIKIAATFANHGHGNSDDENKQTDGNQIGHLRIPRILGHILL
jgi:hypothetical protein